MHSFDKKRRNKFRTTLAVKIFRTVFSLFFFSAVQEEYRCLWLPNINPERVSATARCQLTSQGLTLANRNTYDEDERMGAVFYYRHRHAPSVNAASPVRTDPCVESRNLLYYVWRSGVKSTQDDPPWRRAHSVLSCNAQMWEKVLSRKACANERASNGNK